MRVRLRWNRLQQLVADSRLSQNHWALKMGLSRGHWSEIVNGKHPYPSPKTRQRILEVFELPLEELFIVESGPPTWSDTDFRVAINDRYIIDRELGQGAMGAVYLARDVARGRLVALKVISPEAVSEIGSTALMREIGSLAQLHHPNIIPLYDSGVAADHPFMVMPWVRGGSLRQRIEQEGRLSPEVVARIVEGVAAALDEAHSHHLLHCDIKPENILLHGDHPYVTDFGLSRVLHAEPSEFRAQHSLDLSAGTPAYVSPEQASAEVLDSRSDVYSLGCVVYEMLTGQPPFEGQTTEAIVTQRFHRPPHPLRDRAPAVPNRVEAVVKEAMALRAERRPIKATDFACRLTDAVTIAGGAMTRVRDWALRARLWIGNLSRRSKRMGAGSQLGQDLVLVLRGLRRSPRFVVAFLLPLTLGLGAGGTFFGLADFLLTRPPAGVHDPSTLTRLAITQSREQFGPFTSYSIAWIDHEAVRDAGTVFEGIASYDGGSASLGRGPDARTIAVDRVSASYFPVLGLQPAVGRFFNEEEDVGGAMNAPCVVSHRFWRREFGSDRALDGKTLQVDELTCRVIGVMPKAFAGLDYQAAEVWIPMHSGRWGQNPGRWVGDRYHWIKVIGRLKRGVDLASAEDDATKAYRSYTTRGRDPDLEGTMTVEPLRIVMGQAQGRVGTVLWLLGGAGGLLLLVGANLTNLLLARNLSRSREVAIRIALGGGRLRLFRYYILECGVLAMVAGVASLIVVLLLGPTMSSVLLNGLGWEGRVLDARGALIAFLVALLIGGTVASISAAQTRGIDPAELLRRASGPRVTGGSRSGLIRLGLTWGQALIAMLLLTVSIAFVRSFRNAASMDLGFDPAPVLVASVPLTSAGYSLEQRFDFFRQLRDEVQSVPGVAAAAVGFMTPWFGSASEHLSIPGRDSLPFVPNFGSPALDFVTPDYLDVFGMRMARGRWVSNEDRAGSTPVLVINQALADLYWPGEPSVLGRCIRVGEEDQPCREIVGIVANHRFSGLLTDDYDIAALFLPFEQAEAYGLSPRLFVRATAPDDMIPGLKRLIQGFRPGVPAARVFRLSDNVDQLLVPWRLGSVAFTGLGALSVVVALVGLFSLLAFLVAGQGQEFAIRAALGAQPGQIAAPVVRRGAAIVLGGVLAAFIPAAALSRWIDPLLFQTRLFELPALLSVGTTLVLFGIAASWIPSREAARQDPMLVMRAE